MLFCHYSKGMVIKMTGGIMMKGYVVNDGYMGLVNGSYMLFSCEEDYRDYLV